MNNIIRSKQKRILKQRGPDDIKILSVKGKQINIRGDTCTEPVLVFLEMLIYKTHTILYNKFSMLSIFSQQQIYAYLLCCLNQLNRLDIPTSSNPLSRQFYMKPETLVIIRVEYV